MHWSHSGQGDSILYFTWHDGGSKGGVGSCGINKGNYAELLIVVDRFDGRVRRLQCRPGASGTACDDCLSSTSQQLPTGHSCHGILFCLSRVIVCSRCHTIRQYWYYVVLGTGLLPVHHTQASGVVDNSSGS